MENPPRSPSRTLAVGRALLVPLVVLAGFVLGLFSDLPVPRAVPAALSLVILAAVLLVSFWRPRSFPEPPTAQTGESVAARQPEERLVEMSSAPPPPPPAPGARRLHVLLADDSPVNREVQALLLQRAGHEVQVAANGIQAVEAAAQGGHDLILMDLQMPEMDGLRAARLIRQQEKTTGRRVPIVAVTANDLPSERQRCLTAGMDGYLVKPLRSAELDALLDQLFGPAPAGPALAPVGELPPWATTLAQMGFDGPALGQLVQTFLENVPTHLRMLRQAVAAGDAHDVDRTAHKLVGALGVFDARPALELARRLEQMGRARDLAGAAAELERLEAEVSRLCRAMEAFRQGLSAEAGGGA